MESFITLILADGTQTQRFTLPYEDLASASVIKHKGNYYMYQAFKWQQQEIWYSRVAAPMVLGDNTPKAS